MMPLDEMKSWLQLLLALPALVMAYKLPGVYRWMKTKIAQALAGAMLAHIMPVLEEMKSSIGEVRHQVFPNGGGSMNDTLRAVLQSSERTEFRLGVLQSTARAYQDADLSQARFEAGQDGRMTWVSYALLRWCARSADQVSGYGWLNCVIQDDRVRVRNEWEAAVREQREFALQFKMRGADDKAFLVDAFAKPIRHSATPAVEQWVGTIARVALPQ